MGRVVGVGAENEGEGWIKLPVSGVKGDLLENPITEKGEKLEEVGGID